MTNLPNKREILQKILDGIEPGRSIKKPSPRDPFDVEYLCIFQKVSEHKEASVFLENSLFRENRLDRIRELVSNALHDAKAVE